MNLVPVIILAVCFALGIPVAYSMCIAVIPYFIMDPNMSATVIIQRMVSNSESPSMMAVPFFIKVELYCIREQMLIDSTSFLPLEEFCAAPGERCKDQGLCCQVR